MGKILLQSTDEQWFLPVIAAIEQGCRACGYEVVRWRKREQIQPGARFIIWWGCNIDGNLEERRRAANVQPIYMEQGWLLDRHECCQLDLQGVGGLASWADEPLAFQPAGPLPVRSEGGLLVVLRYEHHRKGFVDNADQLSPFFRHNLRWLEHIAQAVEGFPVRVRPHAETAAAKNAPLFDYAMKAGWQWDASPDFAAATQTAKAVAVIDSTAGAQALELGLPVLCFGRQVYRHEHVVYRLDGNPVRTAKALAELKAGECSLDSGAVGAMVEKIRGKQWYPKDVERFPARMRAELGL